MEITLGEQTKKQKYFLIFCLTVMIIFIIAIIWGTGMLWYYKDLIFTDPCAMCEDLKLASLF